MTFKEMWSEQPPLECKNDLLKDNIHILKWCYEKGQQDVMDSQQELIEAHEKERERLLKLIDKYKEDLKKLRVALIQERTANLMKYGKDGVEIFDSILRMVKEK